MRSVPSRATAHDAVGRATPDGGPRAGTPGYDWTTRTSSALRPGRFCTTRGVQGHTTPSILSGGLRTARGESDVVPKSQRRLAMDIFEFRRCPCGDVLLLPAGRDNNADRRSPEQDADEIRQCTSRDTHRPPPRPLTASHEYAQSLTRNSGAGAVSSFATSTSITWPCVRSARGAGGRSPSTILDIQPPQKLGSDRQSAQALGHHGLHHDTHARAFRPWPWGPGSHRHTRTNAAKPARPSNHLIQRPGKYRPSAPPAPACTQAFPQVSSHVRTLDSTLGCGTQLVESTDLAATSCHSQSFLRAGTPSQQSIKDQPGSTTALPNTTNTPAS